MAKPKHILVAGAGIAGPCLAQLLTRAGHKCTVIERAPDVRSSGQQIDVSGEGLKVIKLMGLDETIRARRVKDYGIKFVDENDRTIAAFRASNESWGLVREIEIMRPDLAGVFHEQTKDTVEYIFGDYITEIRQHDGAATVSFANSNKSRDFDIVVATDVLSSGTREAVFGPDNTKIVSLGMYAGFFSIPWQESDRSWSRWFNATGGRTVTLRPDIKHHTTGAYLSHISDGGAAVARLPMEGRKGHLVELFKDVGWETGRVLKELQAEAGDTFYFLEVAQVKAASWVKDRVALLSDAGYAPSPVTGQGTTLALVGAYVLADCIATHEDYNEALRQYVEQMTPFVQYSQKLFPGVPWIVNPQTQTGIKVMKTVVWMVGLVTNSNIARAIGKVGECLPSLGGGGPKIPAYPALCVNGNETRSM